MSRMAVKGLIAIIGLAVLGLIFMRSVNKPQVIATPPPSNFFVSSECEEACWLGLRPGHTNESEVMDFFGSEDFEDFETDDYAIDSTSYIGLYRGRFFISATVQDGVLLNMQQSGLSDLTLTRIITALGIPPYTLISYQLTPAVGIFNLGVTLYYPESGFVFVFNQSGGVTIEQQSSEQVSVCLSEDDTATIIDISEAGSIETIIQNQSLPFGETSPEGIALTLNEMISWIGFSCVSLPYPPD